MRYFKIVVFALLLSLGCKAQFTMANIGINGLTCSACSRSVELSIRKLDFVDDVQMDLENTSGKVIFKKGAKVDIEKIATAVSNAGFSVSFLRAVFNLHDSLNISENFCLNYEASSYQFIKIPPTVIKDEVTLLFIGKEFLSSTDYKKWKDSLKAQCAESKSHYFVTILFPVKDKI
jgi:copper chaperone CopZ